MIASLTGTTTFKNINSIIISTHGVGYQVFGTTNFVSNLPLKKEATIFTHLHVREDQLTLYGFQTRAELEFFKLLISVSGVGPKSALEILSQAPVDQLKQAIVKAKPDIFFSASGVGKKTASKIVLDLQSKLGKLEELNLESRVDPKTQEALEALLTLGYKRKEALKILKGVDSTLSLGDQIKQALRKAKNLY